MNSFEPFDWKQVKSKKRVSADVPALFFRALTFGNGSNHSLSMFKQCILALVLFPFLIKMAAVLKERNHRKPKAPKELLMFFPQDYSSVKLSKNKILGTAQQRGSLQENTWIEADIGYEQPWKGLIIKTG